MESAIPGTSASASTSSSPIPTTQSTEEPKPGTSQSQTNTESERKKDKSSSDEEREEGEKAFECNICLDVAKDAVVSYCGHLFCWPCLHQWLETRPNRQSCPVCKAAISKDKVIPLYGRGGAGVDPRSKVPPRPTPTRTEQPEQNRFSWTTGNNDPNGAGGSFHMSFGIGAFPFGFFASAFNWGQAGLAGQNFVNPEQVEEQVFLSKLFIWIALIFMAWLLFA